MNTTSSPVTTAAPAAPAPVAPANDGGDELSVDQRVAALHEELRAARPAPAVERTEDVATETPAGPATPVASAADSDSEKRRAERKARLDAVAAQNRESVERKERQAAQERIQREHAEAVARAEAAEKRAAGLVDISALDEASFLRLAEQKGIDGAKLGAWMRDAMTNPERVAEAAALKATQAEYDPKLSAIQAENAALKARLDAFEAQQAASRQAAEDAHHTNLFLGHVEKSAERAPLAVKLLAHDRDEFIEIANIAASRIPAGAGAEALMDKIEDILDSDVRAVSQKYAAIYGSPAATPQAPSRASAPTAAAKANTVSNSLAQERASVVEEEDWAKLPLAERVRRLSRS